MRGSAVPRQSLTSFTDSSGHYKKPRLLKKGIKKWKIWKPQSVSDCFLLHPIIQTVTWCKCQRWHRLILFGVTQKKVFEKLTLHEVASANARPQNFTQYSIFCLKIKDGTDFNPGSVLWCTKSSKLHRNDDIFLQHHLDSFQIKLCMW